MSTTLINACDAGREGELIFRLIAQNAKAKQTVKRLWLQSMTPNAIRDGFAHLRTDEEMLPLADAARCRSEADWLIGINGTRAMTAFNSKEGGFYLTTVGRVQTPTLSIVVEREEKIKQVRAARLLGSARRVRLRRRRLRRPLARHRSSRRTRTIRKSAPSACGARPRPKPSSPPACGKQGNVTEESKPTTSMAPALFDLTVAAARSQRPLRLLGQEHAGPGAGAVRKAQGADLPAYRFARAAGRLL